MSVTIPVMTEPKSAREGFIYVMMSAALEESVYKVGASTNHPTERARQLSMSTSSPLPFVPVCYRKVDYPFQAEAKIHRLLSPWRVNDSREFFKLPLCKIIEIFDTFTELREPAEEIALPWAELFKTFPDDGSARELTVLERAECRELEAQLAKGVYPSG